MARVNQVFEVKNSGTEPVTFDSQVYTRDRFVMAYPKLKNQLNRLAKTELMVELTSSLRLDEIQDNPGSALPNEQEIVRETMFQGFKAVALITNYTLNELHSREWYKLVLERAYDETGNLIAYAAFFIDVSGEVGESYIVTSILHRRRNISTALLASAHHRLKELGINEYYTTLVGAEVVYEKLRITPIPAPDGDNDRRFFISFAEVEA